MKRRDFIALLGGAAIASPLGARAQQAVPVVGYLAPGSPDTSAVSVAEFRKGLSETGFLEGRNVAIEFRFAHDFDQMPELAADLVRRGVAVIAAPGSLPGPLAAKAATTIIPIVFSTGVDPVRSGLVARFDRPGGNVTGFSSMNLELQPKRLGLLHELLPGVALLAVLIDPKSPVIGLSIADLHAAARAIGRQIEVFYASISRDIDAAFSSLAEKRAAGVLVVNNPLFIDRRVQVVALAAHHRVPAIYSYRGFTEAGGLMSYGTNPLEQFRQVGIYTGRILKGEKPSDLPVTQPTRFEFIINLQTARTLGLEVPPRLLALADEVIE